MSLILFAKALAYGGLGKGLQMALQVPYFVPEAVNLTTAIY
jgi:hypothetical protein